LEIARGYRELIGEAARRGSSALEVLATLVGIEAAGRQQRALQRRLAQARVPKRKTLEEYDFNFPKQVPKASIMSA
jgi:DNA replication protein DnaC